jgi:tyrosine-specific transport protein
MLALPVATGIAGFVPSIAMMLLCWLAMTLTALLLLEANLWMEDGAHILTMSSRLLGSVGKGVSWVLYLFICYASLVAYTAGGAHLLSDAINVFTGITLPQTLSCIVFVLVFGFVVDVGARFVGRINAILFVAMIMAYLYLIGAGTREIKLSYLSYHNWSYSILALPLLLTSFSFQTMVPSLTPYLKRNPKAMRWAVIGGTTISLIVYIIWQAVILGIIPVDGEKGLVEALIQGKPAIPFLREAVDNSWIGPIAEFFAFFALATSFLAIALGLVDFLADGLSIKRTGKSRLLLALLIGIPTMLFAIFYERAFFTALEASGGFGDSILNGLIPVMMVWVGRYHKKYLGEVFVPGGKPMLIAIFLFFSSVLTYEVLVHLNLVSSVYHTEEFHEKYEISG